MPVQAQHPVLGPISEQITADAILAPLSQAAISPRVSAAIRAEYVKRGDRVHRGQLLVALDARDLQGAAVDSRGALTSAEANYTAATAATIPEAVKKSELDVTQLKAALDVANRTAEQRARLFREGALSSRDADSAAAAAVQAQAAYDLARQHAELVQSTTRVTDKAAALGQLTSAKGRLQNAQAQASYANLRSPIDGVVTERPLFPGETTSAGTPVITVMDTSSLLAKLHLAQAAAQRLTVGHPAQVTVPGETQPVNASVSFISPALDAGSTTVEVWLKLPNARGALKVGTPVHVSITGNTIANAMQLPPSALVPGQDGTTAVLVAGADGGAHKRAVQVGIRNADAVQIVSGISVADNVITEGGYGLDEGAKVSVGKPGDDKADDGKAGGKAEDKD